VPKPETATPSISRVHRRSGAFGPAGPHNTGGVRSSRTQDASNLDRDLLRMQPAQT
jgi:hypothetical protein